MYAVSTRSGNPESLSTTYNRGRKTWSKHDDDDDDGGVLDCWFVGLLVCWIVRWFVGYWFVACLLKQF